MRSADYYYYYYWHFTNCFHFFGIEVIFYGIIVENHWWYVSILTSKGPNHVLSSFLGVFLFCFLICISHTWIIRSFPGMTFPQVHIISSTNVNMRQTRATRPFFPLWLSLVYQLSIVQKSKAKQRMWNRNIYYGVHTRVKVRGSGGFDVKEVQLWQFSTFASPLGGLGQFCSAEGSWEHMNSGHVKNKLIFLLLKSWHLGNGRF